MISRHWKGIAKPDQAEAYIRHLKSDTFPKLSGIPGFIRASILRRNVDTGTEFHVVTLRSSLDAIKAFAGERPDIAVVPTTVQTMMASHDSHVVHYEVADTYEPR